MIDSRLGPVLSYETSLRLNYCDNPDRYRRGNQTKPCTTAVKHRLHFVGYIAKLPPGTESFRTDPNEHGR